MQLTVAEVKRLFTYDPETGQLLWNRRSDCTAYWNAKWAGKPAGSIRPPYAPQVGISRRLYYLHHLVWFYLYGEWCEYIDHINGDQWDNRQCNLRRATHWQNMGNRNNPNRGVIKTKKGFRARIGINYRKIHLGYFSTREEAQAAYNEASKKSWGEFSSLNR